MAFQGDFFSSAVLSLVMATESNNKKLMKQALFCTGYLALSVNSVARGTCFTDLMQLYNASTSTLSYCIATSAVGIMISSYLGGHMQQKQPHYGFTQTSIFLLLMALSVGLQAHVLHFWGFLMASFFTGIGQGGGLAVIRNQCLITWRGTKYGPGPFMQILFLCKSLGFIVGTIVAKPFLSNDVKIAGKATNLLQNDVSRAPSIAILFPGLGAFIGLVALGFLVLGLNDEILGGDVKEDALNIATKTAQEPQSKMTWHKVFLSSIMLLCFFCSISLLMCVSNYLISSLQNGPLAVSKQEGATLQTLFFAGSFAGRLLSALALMKISANKNLLFSMAVTTVATLVILIFKASSLLVLQVMYGLFGYGIGCLGPGSLIWLEQFFPLKGRVVGLSSFSGALGLLATMVLLGSLVDLVPALIFYYQFGVMVLCMTLVSLGTLLGSTMQKDRGGHKETEKGQDNRAMEMEEHNGKTSADS